MKIHIRTITLYVFSLVIVYLAGIYFGSLLHLLFIFFIIYPILSVVSLFIWFSGVRCFQTFSTKHPVKGETVLYRLTVSNRSVLPMTNVAVKYEPVSESLRVQLKDFVTSLPAQGVFDRTYEIKCPYRGTYTIGVKELVVHDQLRFITLKRRVASETFTVYPRVLNLERFAPVATEIEGSGKYASAGLLPDPTLFQELREYRDGDNIKHIYWKKFASTGRPFLKEYERTKKSGVRIYVDLRRMRRYGGNTLEQEDVSIESLVALVKYLLDRRIHTTVIASSSQPYEFTGQDNTVFEEFYRSTAELHFAETGSPIHMLRSDKSRGRLESQSVVIITHVLDPELFSVHRSDMMDTTIIVFNRASSPEGAAGDAEEFLTSARRKGTDVIPVNSSDSILADLGENAYAFR